MTTSVLKILLTGILAFGGGFVALAEERIQPQFGVASLDGKTGFLALSSPKLRQGEIISLVTVSSGSKPRIITAEVEQPLGSCQPLEKAIIKGPYYSIKLRVDDPTDFDLAIAVWTHDVPKFELGQIVCLVPTSGPRLYFRHCASSEGLHLTVWPSKQLRGKRVWHEYYYLGYGTEPNCTEAEFK